MKILRFIFINVPRRIYFILLHKWEHIYYRYLYSTPELNSEHFPGKYLLFGGESFKDASSVYRQLFPDEAEQKVKDADVICDHTFELLGSGAKKLSAEGKGYRNIDWHIDFKSGYRWDPKTFFRYIEFGHKEGVDIKVPWELSRFQHLNILGQAYILTEDKKYSEEFVNQITDWIESNPVGFGVNWRCAMDVAIRAVNWLVAMEYFIKDNLFSKDFIRMFNASIYEHAKFVRGHLEYAGKWTTNHYLADIAGLFFIAVYCPFFEESREWQDFALKELHGEIEKQVHSDGGCFEASTSYHRLVLEMFFYSALLGRRAGINFSERYINRVKKMFEVTSYCTKPNGRIAQIGDNDNGRFLSFSQRAVLDHRYLINMAAVYYKDGDFNIEGMGFEEESFWLFEADAKNSWDSLPVTSLGSKAFPDAGWYLMRHNKDYCFISCGPNGGGGWHTHNDKLSFELAINGEDLIVDPGTYVYTSYPAERNKFRSTGYHNTIKFGKYEQNEIPEKIMFSLPDRVKIKNAGIEENDEMIVFKGEIHYAGITHKRKVSLSKAGGCCTIEDQLSCPNHKSAKLMFHFPPDLKFNGSHLSTIERNKVFASIEVEGGKFKKDNYDYSPEYGVKAGAEKLIAHIPVTDNKQTVITRIKSV